MARIDCHRRAVHIDHGLGKTVEFAGLQNRIARDHAHIFFRSIRMESITALGQIVHQFHAIGRTGFAQRDHIGAGVADHVGHHVGTARTHARRAQPHVELQHLQLGRFAIECRWADEVGRIYGLALDLEDRWWRKPLIPIVGEQKRRIGASGQRGDVPCPIRRGHIFPWIGRIALRKIPWAVGLGSGAIFITPDANPVLGRRRDAAVVQRDHSAFVIHALIAGQQPFFLERDAVIRHLKNDGRGQPFVAIVGQNEGGITSRRKPRQCDFTVRRGRQISPLQRALTAVACTVPSTCTRARIGIGPDADPVLGARRGNVLKTRLDRRTLGVDRLVQLPLHDTGGTRLLCHEACAQQHKQHHPDLRDRSLSPISICPLPIRQFKIHRRVFSRFALHTHMQHGMCKSRYPIDGKLHRRENRQLHCAVIS